MPANLKPMNILVVDDDPVNLLLTCQTLIGEGFLTTEAESGEAALTAFPGKPYDLVLLDVMMPGIDGFETCRRLRAMPDGAWIPVLIMTGLDDEGSIRKAYDAGATDFITKPITWPLLGHRVRYMLRAGEAMQSLEQSQRQLAHAQRIARLGSWRFDPEQNAIQGSDEFFHILEQNTAEATLPYADFLESVHPEDRQRVDQACRNAGCDSPPCDMEHRLLMPDSRVKWVRLRGVFEADASNERSRFMATMQDITDRKMAEDKVQYLAYYDHLTGLPNRNLFQEHLGNALALARRHKRRLAVLMLNLNRFRRINDTFGHGGGDMLLKLVGEVIQNHVRSGDYTARFGKEDVEVMRWAGDEFAVMAVDISGPDNAGMVASRLLKDLNQSYRLEGDDIAMTACAGIAVFPEDGDSVDGLIKNAQAALWHARKMGPNSCRYYTQAMNAHAHLRLTMESELRLALAHDQLELHYQPLVKSTSGEIVHAEALVRWRHPEKGLIAPGEFIPLAEETGLIIPIGEWVLATACAQNKAWQDAGFKSVTLAVNLAAAHLQRKMLVTHVQEALSRTGLQGRWLELEVTESMLMQNMESSLQVMEEIRSLGVRFAIDDFGTGYSSLSYLKRLPVHSLKIDRSFVRNLPDDQEDLAIVRTIVALGRSLGLTVVAEGVETASQARLLVGEGVDLLQGYLFSKPVPAHEFAGLLTASATTNRLASSLSIAH